LTDRFLANASHRTVTLNNTTISGGKTPNDTYGI